jgi:exodeoxyribonuclease VII large subunit
MSRNLSAAIGQLLISARRELAGIRGAIVQSSLRAVSGKRGSLSAAASRLNALSPLATLARGYAVARGADGSALTSATQFSPGLGFDLLLHDGRVSAETKSVEP